MNKEWSELNKLMQQQINRKDTFSHGINTLLKLRNEIFGSLITLKNELTDEQFCEMPFINANGYHNKSVAYSIWHMFRIEDIVAHTLILGDEQVFFAENFNQKIGSPIITTGNELVKDEIRDFSKALDISALYEYCTAVKVSTDKLLSKLEYSDLKRKISPESRQNLIESGCVSTDENAFWLVDYWCGKDVKGLIKMSFSRHLIMHTEASIRIKNKLL